MQSRCAKKNRYEEWVRVHELDFEMLSKLKRYFNIEKLKIKKVHFGIAIFFLLLALLPLGPMLGAATVAIKPAGLVKINDEGWFWLNSKEAVEYGFLGPPKDAWLLSPGRCKAGDSSPSKLSVDTISEICKAFADDKIIKRMDELVRSQRVAFGFLTAFFLAAILFFAKELMVILNSYDSRMMLLRQFRLHRRKRTSGRS